MSSVGPPVMTEFEFIYFENVTPYNGQKTSVWECRNRKSTDLLGRVQWYGPWRQYVFACCAGVVLSIDCLEDIRGFVMALSARHRDRGTTSPVSLMR